MGASQSRKANDAATLTAIVSAIETDDIKGLEILLSTVTERLAVDARQHGLYHMLALHSFSWSKEEALEICQLLNTKRSFLPSTTTTFTTFPYIIFNKKRWKLRSSCTREVVHDSYYGPYTTTVNIPDCEYIGNLHPLQLAQRLWCQYRADGLAVVMAFLSGKLNVVPTAPPGGAVHTSC